MGGDTMPYYPDTILTIISVGQQEMNEYSELRLFQNYPNPVKNEMKVQLYVPEKDKIVIDISDITGRQLFMQNHYLEAGYHSFKFTPGKEMVYFISVSWRGEIRNIKVLSQSKKDISISKLSPLSEERIFAIYFLSPVFSVIFNDLL